MTIKTITQDTPVSTLPSMIISSQVGHSYYPVTASPVRQASSPDCAGREIGLPGYDGRMTTNSSTSRPAPADARVDLDAGCAAMINSTKINDLDVSRGTNDLRSGFGWVDLDAACSRHAASMIISAGRVASSMAAARRAARLAELLAACPDDTAL